MKSKKGMIIMAKFGGRSSRMSASRSIRSSSSFRSSPRIRVGGSRINFSRSSSLRTKRSSSFGRSYTPKFKPSNHVNVWDNLIPKRTMNSPLKQNPSNLSKSPTSSFTWPFRLDTYSTRQFVRRLARFSEQTKYRLERMFTTYYEEDQNQGEDDKVKYSRTSQNLKVFGILLACVYANDDGVVSRLERRTFRRMVKLDREKLNEQDYHEIIDIINLAPSKEYTLEYLTKLKAPIEFVHKATKRILELTDHKEPYKSIINYMYQRYMIIADS